jgi:AraC family L-rhamnose operon transcriptional activator RhaR
VVLQHDVAEHDHDFYELALITGGSAVHHSIYGNWELREGCALLLGPNAWHAYRHCHQLVVVNACFPIQVAHRELRWALEDAAFRALLWPASNCNVMVLRLDEEAMSSCERVLLELEDDRARAASRPRAIGRLLLLLGTLAAHADADAIDATDRFLRARPWVAATAQLLREHYGEPWQLTRLAEHFAVDPTHLARTFRAVFGAPPMAYLARIRAEAAAELLLETHHSITEIAAQVGWPDSNYFARRFRAHFGTSPTEYRRTRLAESI